MLSLFEKRVGAWMDFTTFNGTIATQSELFPEMAGNGGKSARRRRHGKIHNNRLRLDDYQLVA